MKNKLMMLILITAAATAQADSKGATPRSAELRLDVEQQFVDGKKWKPEALSSAAQSVLDRMYDVVNVELREQGFEKATEESVYNVLFVVARVRAREAVGDLGIYAYWFCDNPNFRAAFSRLNSNDQNYLLERLTLVDLSSEVRKCSFPPVVPK